MVKTQIQIEVETRDMLTDLGKKGESYDDIIRRLISRKKVKEAA